MDSLDRNDRRDKTIDLLKGLAIILVVYGHTWPFCRRFIYLFHLAVFLMSSGYCYVSSPPSIKAFGKYVIKKAKGLYIPFVVCNGFFTLLTGLMLRIGLLTDNPVFLMLTESWPVKQSIVHSPDFIDLLKEIIKVLSFFGITQMGTATWFLTSLFIVNCCHYLIDWLIKKVDEKKQTIIFTIMLLFLLGVSQFISSVRPNVIFPIKCFPCTYSAFLMGFLIRKSQWKQLYKWYNGLIALLILICFSFFFDIELSAGRISNVFVFLVSSLCGWVFLKTLASYLASIKNRIIEKALVFIGRHTLPIVCLHVISFKIVTWIYICINRLPIIMLASFHIVFDVDEVWKFVYALFGVSIPLFCFWIYNKIKLFIKDRIIERKSIVH